LLSVSVCVCLYIPPTVASQRLGKNPLIVARQRLGKNPPIVARQRFGKNPPIVARQQLGKNTPVVAQSTSIEILNPEDGGSTFLRNISTANKGKKRKVVPVLN
jgi:hypothetical protein